jgi:hypothetical protein
VKSLATTLTHALAFISLGILIGAGLVYHLTRSQAPTDASGVMADRQWCDPAHTIPYIPASECGNGSSCARAAFVSDGSGPLAAQKIDWPALCKSIAARYSGR